MRNVATGIPAETLIERQIETRRRDPIDIVIAVKTDPLLASEGLM